MSIIKNKYGSNIAGIILLGASNCGKGTQSGLILNKYEGSHISVGDEIREKLESDKNFKGQYGPVVGKSALLPDEVALTLVQSKARNIPHRGIVVVDGFCRNHHQADMIDRIFCYPACTMAVEFRTELDILVQRAIDRGRPDDKNIRDRFKLWTDHRCEVIRKLSSKGIVTIPVDASRDLNSVFEDFHKHVCDHVRKLKSLAPRPSVRHPHDEHSLGRLIVSHPHSGRQAT